MATSNKPTAVHYSLIAFVMIALVLAVMAFMFHKEGVELTAAAEAAKKESDSNKTIANRALDSIATMKKLLGHEYESVGTADDQNQSTVAGAMRADIALAGDPAQPTYSAAIRKVVQELKQMTSNRDDLNAKLAAEHAKLLALQGEYQNRVDERQKATVQAEGDLQNKNRSADEDIAKKDKDIQELQGAYKTLQADLDNTIAAADKEKKLRDIEISKLSQINIQLQDELNTIKQVSFEREHGQIVYVDNTSRLVWINLGSADRLPVRTTFSVYNKNNSGIARGNVDVKGAIEVTRILKGPHLAEARILKDDIYNPISSRDPIYTPLWNPGRSENFSFVGKIDLDGDGQEDRATLHEIVSAAGARIDNEVDAKGILTGAGIDVNTKFLVIGDIPEVADTDDKEAEKIILDIKTHQTELRKQAREQGVRVITLGDFLNYIGYKPQSRVFRPGDDRPYNLRSGAQSASVGESLGTNRHSSGTTSGVYGGNKNAKPKTSPGTNSKLFRSTTGG
jgi:hypothetical protein